MKKYRLLLTSLIILLVINHLPKIYEVLSLISLVVYDRMLFNNLSIVTILFYCPLAFALLSLLYGLRKGFVWWIPLAFGATFLPVILWEYLFYNTRGIEIYLFVYLVISLFFLMVGAFFRYLWKKSRSTS